MVDLKLRSSQGALWITLNRPQVYNALTMPMLDRMAEVVELAAARDDVRVIVVTGAGPAFSAGADFGGDDASEGFDVTSLDHSDRLIRAIVGTLLPVVAAVHGVAAGVGASIALASDLVVCAESASFLLAFATIGLMPGGGTSATVAAAIGRARTMRMALLAEPLSAREAYDAGLVTHLATDEDFPPLLASVVSRLATGAPLAQAATKQAVNAATLAALEPILALERTGQSALLRSRDVVEGMRAFTEQRPPHFRGE